MEESLVKFRKVVEMGNITKAAEELGISQPGLSAAILALEEQFGTPLLIRNRKGVFATKVGKLVYDYAEGELERFQRLTNSIAREIKRDATRIRIGMIDNTGLVTISRIYLEFVQNHSALDVQIWVDNSRNLVDLVYNNRVDFAIVTKPEVRLPEGVIVEDFSEEAMVLVAVPPIANSVRNIEDINKVKFVGYNESSTSYKLIKSRLDELELKPSYLTFSTSPEFMKHIILLGMGIGFLPRNLVMNEISRGELQIIGMNEFRIVRQLSLVYRSDVYLSKVKKEFLSELTSSYSDQKL